MLCHNARTGWLGGSGAALILLTGTAVMLRHGDFQRHGDVPFFLLGAGVMLLGFFCALALKSVPVVLLGSVAVLARLLLLFQAPGADIFRYLWEGKMLLFGINPYLHAPDAIALFSLRDPVWELVEHREYTAIYPPLTEWCFALLAGISPTVFVFKLAFAAADLLAGWLLWIRFGAKSALIYLWNPLILYSFSGGGHFDSLFVLALVLAWLAWEVEKFNRAVVWLGVAVAVKWMALPLVAWAGWQVFRKHGARTSIFGFFLAGLPICIAWLGIGLWTGEWTLRLYPEKFAEWARSADLIPAIVAAFWPESRFHNSWFAPPLLLGWAIVILRARKFTDAAEWSFFLALIFSPLVHGWYFTWLIPFAVATRNLGTLLLSASAFVYFIVYQRYQMQLDWSFTPLEIALLWGPFFFGFLWEARSRFALR